MRQLPKHMVPLLAASASMYACKSSTHDVHKSVFWGHVAPRQAVRTVDKLKCQREHAGARAKGFGGSRKLVVRQAALSCRSSSPTPLLS